MREVRIKRIYDPPEAGDGRRVLVDRLWPRGLAKDKAELDVWMRDIAPSDELRTWYGHEPERFGEFARRYRAELNKAGPLIQDLLATPGTLTLLTATRDVERSQAAVLAAVLQGE